MKHAIFNISRAILKVLFIKGRKLIEDQIQKFNGKMHDDSN